MAVKFCRHFRALARKNFINWKRTPVCSILEFLFPVILMSGLAIFRGFVDISTPIDQAGMLNKKAEVFPALAWDEQGSGIFKSYKW